MMTSSQIRQSFLDFFKSKQHTIVPSASLMPDSPNLLFTNAGMNQFVPIFLGQTKCPYTPGRAADTQKCIRAGGKHNDLDDVGLDTYHLTFFEMLGNWSFGDYFKKESLTWGWELLTKVWGIPPKRLFATVYSPDKSKGDPSEFDQEASDIWTEIFRQEGLDPKIHIVHGNKKDNFWMMGETGPCGPCSEIHFNLLPSDDEQPARALVNAGSQRCIEIWNHVFIQFNANPGGTYSPLPAKHVDTGMGFDRIAGFYAGTNGFKEFSELPSAYNTDIFTALFAELEKLSGKKYGRTLPVSSTSFQPVNVGPASSLASGATETAGKMPALPHRQDVCATTPEQIALDIAFRVIADHIRTLSFAIADGIQPGNTDRNYVLRRILRRAVRYGRTLGFHEPFFYKLVDVLADTMGDVFPEIRVKKKHVQDVIRVEEEAFNKTLDTGLSIFEQRMKVQPDLDEVVKELHESSFVDRTREDLKTMPDAYEAALPVVKRIRERARRIMYGPGYSTDGAVLKTISMAGGALLAQDFAVLSGMANLFTKADEILKASASSGAILFQDFSKTALDVLFLTEKSFVEARLSIKPGVVPGAFAFLLYDTYGFPLDLTELMARERGLTVDKEGFEKLMEEQRARARAAQKKEVISLSQIETTTPTKFVGFDKLETDAKVVEVVSVKDKTAVILDTSACYAEMGGQVGDTGEILVAADGSQPQTSPSAGKMAADSRQPLRITNTQKSGNTWLHFVDGENIPALGDEVVLRVDLPRRSAIQRHHTVTHLLHWALHEVVSKEASQKGSFVGPDKLTFDFNSTPLTPAQVADIEKLVNERILENAGVSWTEVPYADVKSRKDVMQFFGDKYGDTVRVVQIGGHAAQLDGYSMELCGGTHTRATGEIGLFRIVGENAIAAGVRRIEAIAGLTAYDVMKLDRELIKTVAGKVNSPIHELDKKIEALLAHQKELEKQVKIAMLRNASNAASELLGQARAVNGIPVITHNLGDADGEFLQATADALKGRFKGVVVLGGCGNNAVTLIATVSADFTAKVQAGKIIQQIALIVGGKGGGKPDNARGGGKDASKLDEALAKAKSLLS